MAAASAHSPPPQASRRYAAPFVGARVRAGIGGFLPLLQRLECQLLLGSEGGGFDLGDLDALQRSGQQHPAHSAAAMALRILQGKRGPLPGDIPMSNLRAGRETWLVLAARDGLLELVQALRERGCPWGTRTCEAAARGGHLAVLQWARGEGCPWDGGTCWAAAGGGHLEVLQWARAQGCPWDARTSEGAAQEGHMELVQWLRAQGSPGMLGQVRWQ